MRRHVGALRWLVAAVLCVVMANVALAHVAIQATGNHRQFNAITSTPSSGKLPCSPNPTCAGCRTGIGTVVWPTSEETKSGANPWGPETGCPSVFGPGDPWTIYHNDSDPGFTYRTYVGAYFDNTGGAAANKVAVTAIAIGEGSQAGPHTSAYVPPDTAFASVGLYGPGPVDSMLIAIVDRSSPTSIGIHFSTSSALQVRSLGNSHEQPQANLRMFVYEDEATANADVNNIGATAKFRGTVSLDGQHGTVTGCNGFGPSDWFVVNNGPGKYTARPSPGLTKNVPVLNSSNACVRLLADPSIVQATPGQSPLILALIALALAGAGVWAIRRRTPGPTLA